MGFGKLYKLNKFFENLQSVRQTRKQHQSKSVSTKRTSETKLSLSESPDLPSSTFFHAPIVGNNLEAKTERTLLSRWTLSDLKLEFVLNTELKPGSKLRGETGEPRKRGEPPRKEAVKHIENDTSKIKKSSHKMDGHDPPEETEMSVKKCKVKINYFKKYIIDTNRIIKASDVAIIIEPILGSHNFEIDRIRKRSINYLRLCIKNSVLPGEIRKALITIQGALDITVRLSKNKTHKVIEARENKFMEETSILTLNINKLRRKLTEIDYQLRETRPSIICLQETRNKPGDKFIHINQYRCEEVRESDKGPGLLIGVRKDTGLITKILDKSDNVIAFSVSNQITKMVVINVYKHASGETKNETMKIVKDLLKKYEENKNYDAVTILGDWNQQPGEITGQLRRFGCPVFATSAPTKGTRIKKNRHRTDRIIDFAVSNDPDLIGSQICLRDWNISDHIPVLIKLNLKHKCKVQKTKLVFDRERSKNKKIIKKILDESCIIDTNLSAEESIKLFSINTRAKLEELNIISNKVVGKKEPYISNRIKQLVLNKREKDKLVRKEQAALSEFTEARKKLKRELKRYGRKQYLKFIRKGIDFLKNNDHRNSWKWLKLHSGRNKKSAISSEIRNPETNELVSNMDDKLKIWVEHFKGLCKKDENEKTLEVEYQPKAEISAITDCPITWEEIIFESKCTRTYKAAGVDQLPSELYKIVEKDPECRKQFSKNILYMFNKVLNEGICPTDWELCTVVPIFKKGDQHDPNNYRGIALINTMQKLFAKILARRLQTACNDHGLIKREQAGFTTAGECTSQVACLLESCQRRKLSNQDTYLCFLDLRKAYDLVPHNRLILKLKAMGIGPRFIKLIETMYKSTKMAVKIGDKVSEPFKYERGVRQGCPTSPQLFNIYIDDLIDELDPISVPGLPNGLKGLLFADDTVITAESSDELCKKLELIKKWMDENSMEINSSKCGVMLISSNNTENNCVIKYSNEVIQNVTTYTYLGVQFNCELDLARMAKFRKQKGLEVVAGLSKTLRNQLVPLEYKRMLVNNVVIPTVLYGSEIFGMSEPRIRPLKQVADKAIGLILNSKKFCRVRAYEELDLKPVQIRAACARARGLSKWKDGRGLISDLIRSINEFKNRKRTWIKATNAWTKRFKIRNEEMSIQTAIAIDYTARIKRRDHSGISNRAGTSRYSSGKKIRRLQIKDSKAVSGTHHLTKIRTGTFKFVNDYVYCKKLDRRHLNKCIFCKKDVVENEEHLVFYCSAWRRERQTHLEIATLDNPPNDQNSLAEVRKILSCVLGGTVLASSRKPAEWLSMSCRFLSAIVKRRSAIIAETLIAIL